MMSNVLRPEQVERYLTRIGLAERPPATLDTLRTLQRAHLTHIAFENIDVFMGRRLSTLGDEAAEKVLDRGRGGWCFELNGAFIMLLQALGFSAQRLAAAVQLSGPTEVVDHLCVQVILDEPWLVDVGFGDSFIQPLGLNSAEPQTDPRGVFELIPSPRGITLSEHVDGVPDARYRFTRVAHAQSDFDEPSDRLQDDRTTHWHRWPFATRLLDGGPDRVTLLADRIKTSIDGDTVEVDVAPEDWPAALDEWFSMTAPDGIVDRLRVLL